MRLRAWQTAALAAWSPTHRGIVSVVTGGGKTMLALAAIRQSLDAEPGLRVLILVPTVSLADQWFLEVQDYLDESKCVFAGRDRGETVVIMVLNTARKRATGLLSTGQWLLVVDECHRAASRENAVALATPVWGALGLSATPEREHDDLYEQVLVPALGPRIFEYDYAAAARDGVVVPFELQNYRVPLTEQESKALDELNAKIGRAVAIAGGDFHAPPVQALLLRRARAIQNIESRIPSAVALVLQNPRDRTLVFHESTAAADLITRALAEQGVRVVEYHSRMSGPARRQALHEFRQGMSDVLVCCRALDEGLNVPRTERAVVASATGSQRQRIQRLGRVLRPHDRKTKATIATLYATELERARLLEEATGLAELVAVRWFGVRL